MLLCRYSNRDKTNYGNAQEFISRLHQTMTGGTRGVVLEDDLEEALTNFKLTTQWTKSNQDFLVSFQHKLTDLDGMPNANTNYPDPWRCKCLHASVHTHPKMAAYIDTLDAQHVGAAQAAGTALVPWTFDAFYQALDAYAVTLD